MTACVMISVFTVKNDSPYSMTVYCFCKSLSSMRTYYRANVENTVTKLCDCEFLELADSIRRSRLSGSFVCGMEESLLHQRREAP